MQNYPQEAPLSHTRRDHPLARFIVAAAAMAACLTIAGCRVNAASAEGSISTTIVEAKSLVLTNENGSVEIVKDPSVTGVQVTAKIRCAAESREVAEARVKVTNILVERGGEGRVSLKVCFPSRTPDAVRVQLGWSGYDDDGANVVIRAASLDGIEVKTSNGSITSGAFSGKAKLETSNGSIRVDGHTGPVDLDASNGGVTAIGVGTPVVAETSNGSVEVSLAANATGDVKIGTSNGLAQLQLPAAWQGTVRGNTSNGGVEITLPTDAPNGSVVTRGGQATTTIGDGTKAKATVDTSNGRVIIRTAPIK